MKDGDRVEVIKRLPCDFDHISIGDKGTVVETGSDLVYIVLDRYKGMTTRDFSYLYADGSYQFGMDRLEVIE